MIKMIFATTLGGHFGLSDGSLPWKHMKGDMQHFFSYTKGCILIMGRGTWDSLPEPKLPGRVCIVVSSIQQENVHTVKDLTSALLLARSLSVATNICIIGGRRLLLEGASHADEVSISHISTQCLKTSNWNTETYFLDTQEILEVLGERGITDFTQLLMTDELNIFKLTRGI